MMTPEQLAAWRALAEAATPGPWVIAENTVQAGGSLFIGTIFSDDTPANAAFIAAARTAVPALLAEVERLRSVSGKPQPTDAENEAAAERIRQIDVLYARHGNDTQRWPGHAQDRLLRLNTEQDAYEAAYC